jgi:hypothetical protein
VGIIVKNMSGDVALNGTVPSHPQHLEATAAANLMVVLPVGDYRDDATLTTAALRPSMTR